ncbi:hypothetical protein D9M72_230850 [compost metagenome]
MRAPGSTTTSAVAAPCVAPVAWSTRSLASTGTCVLPRVSLYRPRLNCASLMPTAAATRLRVSTWLLPLNTMPLRFTTITVPSAWICPWICEGRAFGSFTRLSTDQLACWSNFTVVFRPTLKVSQLRIALSAVCSTVTTVRPAAWRCESVVSGRALCQPAVSAFVSTFRPPSARPSGTEGSCCAAARAAACADCCAAMARAARFRLPRDCCSCSLARCCCACGPASIAAGRPFGRRPVASAVLCAMFFCAIHAPLNACCACAPSNAAPPASSSAMARTSGVSRTCANAADE